MKTAGAILLLQAVVTARGQVSSKSSLAGAARDGDLARVKSLIASSSQSIPDLEQRDDFFREETALNGAARMGHLDIVRYSTVKTT